MAKCTFCGNAIEPGTGKMFVYVTGKVDYYCSNRCEKNLHKLKRKPLQTRWTQAYRSAKGKIASSAKLPKDAKPKATTAAEPASGGAAA